MLVTNHARPPGCGWRHLLLPKRSPSHVLIGTCTNPFHSGGPRHNNITGMIGNPWTAIPTRRTTRLFIASPIEGQSSHLYSEDRKAMRIFRLWPDGTCRDYPCHTLHRWYFGNPRCSEGQMAVRSRRRSGWKAGSRCRPRARKVPCIGAAGHGHPNGQEIG